MATDLTPANEKQDYLRNTSLYDTEVQITGRNSLPLFTQCAIELLTLNYQI